MRKILIPYISQDNILHKYYIRRQQDSGGYIFNSGIYPRIDNENEYIYSIISEPLILYDEVIITKDDLCYLLTIIEPSVVGELLDSGSLKIVDTNSFRFIRTEDIGNKWGLFITDQGQEGNAGFRSKLEDITGTLLRKIDQATIKFVNSDEFIVNIINESNKDLINGSIIQSLNYDSIVKHKQNISLYNYDINRIFYMNYFYALQAKLNVEFIYQDEVLYNLLRDKISAFYSENEGTVEDDFFNILRFNNILDIKKLVAEKRLSIDKLLDIRESKNCKEFKEWLFKIQSEKEQKGTDSLDIIRAFHEACIEKGKIEKFESGVPYKILNIAIPTAIGFIPIAGPVLGAIYSAFENFKSFYIKDWKPNLFINDLKRY